MAKRLFQPGEDARRGRGGKRPGAGRKPLAIRKLTDRWKEDTGTIVELLMELKRLALRSEDESVRVAAIREYLNRVIGKPRQEVSVQVRRSELVDLYRGVAEAVRGGELRDLMAED